ncbi:MAG: bifunctional phosphoglucose/phosphomannose isomerase [Candidatus Saccharimonas sp.]
MFDDNNVIQQRDRQNALTVASNLWQQANFAVDVLRSEHDDREIKHIVVAGMGGSALAADMAKTLLKKQLSIPFEVVKTYELPRYVGKNSLVIASSHSGNTEETVGCLEEALRRDAQIAVIASGGMLQQIAEQHDIMTVHIPHDTQPRMAVLYNLRALLRVFSEYSLIDHALYEEMSVASEWLKSETDKWISSVSTDQNYAKQLALLAVGKTPVFYAGDLMAPVAYKWKISWNENAKNVAFWNYLPEFNHNEFLGWTSHPIEKPFAVFDLVSNFEHPRILKRFEVTDRLLSGKRPKAITVQLAGDSPLKQMLWASILADFVSIYVALLNNVDPTQVDLIETFKKSLDN